MKSRGYRLGLVSNCSIEVPDLWGGAPFRGLFDTCVFSACEGLVKPDKEIYLRAVSRLEVEPERCLYVGDGESNELDGAAGVGMDPWLLLLSDEEPPRSQEHLEAVSGWRHRRLRSYSEVLDVLDGKIR